MIDAWTVPLWRTYFRYIALLPIKKSQIVHANMDRLDISSFREFFFPLFPLKSLSLLLPYFWRNTERGYLELQKLFFSPPLFSFAHLHTQVCRISCRREKKKENGNYDTAEERGKFLCINIRLGKKKRGVQERGRKNQVFLAQLFFSWEIFCFANIVILSFADDLYYLPFDTVI